MSFSFTHFVQLKKLSPGDHLDLSLKLVKENRETAVMPLVMKEMKKNE